MEKFRANWFSNTGFDSSQGAADEVKPIFRLDVNFGVFIIFLAF